MAAVLLFYLLGLAPLWAEPPTLLALGDSLTEGSGVAETQAWPSVLESRLQTSHPGLQIINAGVSGATTAGGLARLKWSMRANPQLLILGLGANNGLRGLPPKEMQADLEAILEYALERLSARKILLLGMQLPANYGEQYRQRFFGVFKTLADQYSVRFYPFLLKDVAMHPELNQPDGIHPNARGHSVIAQNLLQPVLEMLKGQP